VHTWKQSIHLGAGLLVLTMAPNSSRGTPELAGVLSASEQIEVVLSDKATGQTSSWLKIGGRFEDYTIASYDGKKGQLVLQRGRDLLVLTVRSDRATDDPRFAIVGTISLGTGDQATKKPITLRYNEATFIPLPAGGYIELTPSLRPDGMYEIKFVHRGNSQRISVIVAAGASIHRDLATPNPAEIGIISKPGGQIAFNAPGFQLLLTPGL
jgi:hypothetical protein